MNLHENKELFADAVLAASQSKEDGGLGIKQIFIEKDYWISRSLKKTAAIVAAAYIYPKDTCEKYLLG